MTSGNGIFSVISPDMLLCMSGMFCLSGIALFFVFRKGENRVHGLFMMSVLFLAAACCVRTGNVLLDSNTRTCTDAARAGYSIYVDGKDIGSLVPASLGKYSLDWDADAKVIKLSSEWSWR